MQNGLQRHFYDYFTVFPHILSQDFDPHHVALFLVQKVYPDVLYAYYFIIIEGYDDIAGFQRRHSGLPTRQG